MLASPTKVATKRLAGSVVERFGGGDLFDAAVIHHADPVGHHQRFALVVGDVDEGDAEAFVQALDLELEVLAQLLVERAQRLVHQQHAGAEDDGAGDGDALLLAAGELLAGSGPP